MFLLSIKKAIHPLQVYRLTAINFLIVFVFYQVPLVAV